MTPEQIRSAAWEAAGEEAENDGTCPDCLPHSRCLACADDERFHADLDARLEDS